jgi:hypothetical protein
VITISVTWLVIWFGAFGVLGGIIGWASHGLVQEHRDDELP